MSTETAVAAISACAAVLALALAVLAAHAACGSAPTGGSRRCSSGSTSIWAGSRTVWSASSTARRGFAPGAWPPRARRRLRRPPPAGRGRGGDAHGRGRRRGPVRRPRRRAASAEFGSVSGTRSLDAPLAQATGPFRAVTINWSYRPGDAGSTDPITSALVVPIVEDGRETGTISAYAPASAAFGPEHVRCSSPWPRSPDPGSLPPAASPSRSASSPTRSRAALAEGLRRGARARRGSRARDGPAALAPRPRPGRPRGR